MKYEIGSRIRITAEEATYEGTVCSYDEHIHRLVLEKAIGFPGGKEFHHVLIFFENQILKAEVIEKTILKKAKLAKRNKSETSQSEANPVERNDETIRSEAVSSVTERDKGGDPKNAEENFTVHVIKEVDEKFYDAINYLKKQSSLSLSIDGINVGRFGEICLLQIGTKNKEVYQFNMISMGRKGYDLGLLELLTCPNIQMIIHDCRWISDALYYQLNVNLVSVYDTQVADATVYKKEHNDRLPDRVRNLEECLDDYLNVKIEMFSLAKKDHRFWKHCLADPDFLKKFVQEVVFLHDLQAATTERMLAEFRNGVEVYLNSIRSLPDLEAQKISNFDLPVDFTEAKLKQSRQKEKTYYNGEDLLNDMRKCSLDGNDDNWKVDEGAKKQTEEFQETQDIGANSSSDSDLIINWDMIRGTSDSPNSSSGKRTQKSKVQFFPAGYTKKSN